MGKVWTLTQPSLTLIRNSMHSAEFLLSPNRNSRSDASGFFKTICTTSWAKISGTDDGEADPSASFLHDNSGMLATLMRLPGVLSCGLPEMASMAPHSTANSDLTGVPSGL